MSYQLTLVFDDIDELVEAVKAISAAPTAKAPPAEPKARTKKSTNGKTAESLEAETPAEANPDSADSLKQALKICRELLDSGDDEAKKGLKALRDELDVRKLSDVPLEAAATFLAKAQALQDKHSA